MLFCCRPLPVLSCCFVLLASCHLKPINHKLASESVPELPGTWAKQIVVTSEASALGIKSKTTIIRYSLLHLEQQENRILAQDKACEIVVENSGSSSLTFPPAILASIPVSNYQYDLVQTASGAQLERKNAVETFGVKLSSPLTDPLPSAASDPAIFDQDKDGQPGVSVDVSAKALFTIKGTMYIIQKQIWTENARILDADTMNGPVVWSQEQKILGSSNSLLTSVTPSVTPILKESMVNFRRLANGADCEGLKAQKSSLFNLRP